MKSLKLLAAGLFVATALGCQAKNADLTAPPEVVNNVQEKGGEINVAFNPKVDILFVIDDSMSMDGEQKALSANIDSFVNAFAKFELIDFHIGVTRVTDLNPNTVKTRAAGAQICAKSTTGRAQIDGFNMDCKLVTAQNPTRGELVALRNIDPKTNQLVEYPDARFITRQTPDFMNVLRNTLKVGTRYIQYGGSEHEEIFHPLVGVFSNSAAQKTNKGFFRPDAAVLAVFILTDADDAQNAKPSLSAQETAALLKSLKSKGKLLTFGGLSLGSAQGCEKDPVLLQKRGEKVPDIIMDFLAQTDGGSMDICSSNLGTSLANFGTEIKKEILTKGFALKSQPEIGTLKVFYGSTEIPKRNKEGLQMWGYEVDRNGRNPRVTLTEHADFQVEKGATLRAEYTPLVMKNVKNGRTSFVGAK